MEGPEPFFGVGSKPAPEHLGFPDLCLATASQRIRNPAQGAGACRARARGIVQDIVHGLAVPGAERLVDGPFDFVHAAKVRECFANPAPPGEQVGQQLVQRRLVQVLAQAGQGLVHQRVRGPDHPIAGEPHQLACGPLFKDLELRRQPGLQREPSQH